jgi:hypothetical protein
VLSTHYNISDSVRQDLKWEIPYNLQVGARHKQYCWEQHSKGMARKALGEVLVHVDSLREDPCPGFEQEHLRYIQLQVAPLEIEPPHLECPWQCILPKLERTAEKNRSYSSENKRKAKVTSTL